MIQVYWDQMPPLRTLLLRLQPWGEATLLNNLTLRYIPNEPVYPVMYFNANGLIEVLVQGDDLFHLENCINLLEHWSGKERSIE